MNSITSLLTFAFFVAAMGAGYYVNSYLGAALFEAANIYAGHPEALQMRAMNIVYETTKERGATILMPSSMVDSMNPDGNTLALAIAGGEALKPNGALKVAELPRPAVAA